MAVKEESKHQHLSKNVYKQNWNLRNIRNIQVLEKLCQHQHRPQTYPNIPKQLEPQGWERYEDPGPCTSRDRVVTIPNLPMVAPAIGLNQLCIGIVQLLSSQWRKNASLQFVEIVPAKKKLVLWPWSAGYLRNFSWKCVKHKSSKVSEMMAQHLATMWHWSPVSVRWPWLHVMLQGQLTPFMNGKPASALPLIAHAVEKSNQYICPRVPIPPWKVEWHECSVSGSTSQCVFFSTSCLSLRGQVADTPLSLDTYNISRWNTLHRLNAAKKDRHKVTWRESTVGRIIGKEAETVTVIPMSALLYRPETSHVGCTLHQWNTMI